MSIPPAFLDVDPVSMHQSEKERIFCLEMSEMTRRHRQKCGAYGKILESFGVPDADFARVEDVPFLPVRLFKNHDLRSVDAVGKTLTSSGTSSQKTSRIHIDAATSQSQIRALSRIGSSFLGATRLPMIIIDSEETFQGRTSFSARTAGIRGFSIFAREKLFALDSSMRPRMEAIHEFARGHRGETILVFGFTSIVWQHFQQAIPISDAPALQGAVLIHGGGWKRMVDQAVSRQEFESAIREKFGIARIHDYYGMAEQTGSINMQCEAGSLHCSVFSDIVVRRPADLSPAALGEEGVVETLSVLPESYPGHALLTEDVGVLDGIDDCPCGRLGKRFRILGRLPKAEKRGCSDTYERA